MSEESKQLSIVVAGAKLTDKASEFCEFVKTQERNVEFITLGDVAKSKGEDEARGVVLFVDGRQPLTEWVSQINDCASSLDVPLVVVPGQTDSEVKSRLVAAGASAVCDAGATDRQILSEIDVRCNVKPALSKLRHAVLDPFITATKIILQELSGIESEVKKIEQKRGYRFGDISAVLGLVSKGEGALVMSLPRATATELTGRLLMTVDLEPTEEMVKDCVGELVNMVAGRTRGMVANTEYTFGMSTPTVVFGTGHEIHHRPGMLCFAVSFDSDVGDFVLQLCMSLPSAE